MSAASQISWDNPHGISWDDDPLKTGKGMEAAAHNQARPTTLPGGGQPSYTALALQNSPSGADPHNPGNPNLNAVPESEREGVNTKLATTQGVMIPATEGANALIEGGVPRLLKYGRGLLGATAGGATGAYGGSRVGSMLGPQGEAIGGTLGGLAGSVIGGGAASGITRDPLTMKMNPAPFGVQRVIPEWMVPGGVPEGDLARASFMNSGYAPVTANPRVGEEGLGEFMSRGYAPADEANAAQAIAQGKAAKLPVSMPKAPTAIDPVRQAVREGKASLIPTRMPAPQLPAVPPDELALAVREGRAARLPVRMPTQAIEPAPTDPLKQAIQEGRAARIPVRMPRRLPATTPSGIPIDQRVAGTRSLILTPSEAASEDVMQRIAKTRASQRGMQFAAGMTPREGRSAPRLPASLPEAEPQLPRERVTFPDEEDDPETDDK